MATDQKGNALNVGDNVWIPATITGINTGGITVSTAYGSQTISTTGPQTHKDKPTNFPDLP